MISISWCWCWCCYWCSDATIGRYCIHSCIIHLGEVAYLDECDSEPIVLIINYWLRLLKLINDTSRLFLCSVTASSQQNTLSCSRSSCAHEVRVSIPFLPFLFEGVLLVRAAQDHADHGPVIRGWGSIVSQFEPVICSWLLLCALQPRVAAWIGNVPY